ncbi:MAG: hypothetical protein B7X84_06055 [Alphaproteobacteria bacterium 17-39-52]|nr:MAG: hypothetical protein B7X84_06055 [Alphaproteobacteria bacterium 17-39-52]
MFFSLAVPFISFSDGDAAKLVPPSSYAQSLAECYTKCRLDHPKSKILCQRTCIKNHKTHRKTHNFRMHEGPSPSRPR